MVRCIYLLLLLLAAAPAAARTLEVGPGRQYRMPSEAAAAAADGDRIVVAPGEYFDCAVLRQDNLVIEGSGPAGGAVMTDRICQGKAILVTTGTAITVRNLTLTRARAPDGNGAGIRSEGQSLVVERVRFIDNQNGILTGSPDGSTLLVRDSEFLRNGICMAACAHSLYAGHLALLRVERSRFFETRDGHHIKSRAERTEVVDCDIADGPQGTSSYLIDIPNGGSVMVRGNTLQKGPKSGNHTAAIMIGAEGVTQPTREILIEDNTLRNDGDFRTVFVDNVTATGAQLKGNRLSGPVTPLQGDGGLE